VLGLLLGSPASGGECRALPDHLLEPMDVPDRFDGRSPTRWYRKADFRPACQGLNLCYARVGSFRAECEDAFFRELQGACRSTYDGYWEEEARGRCLLAVSRYRAHHGETEGEAFRDAQYEGRWLEDTGRRKVPRRFRKWITEELPAPAP